MFKSLCCCATFAILSAVLLGVLFLIGFGNQRNNTLLSGEKDADIALQLDEIATPVIESLNLYYTEQGEYPVGLDSLIPGYIATEFPDFLGGRPVYISEPRNGIPFYFAYVGNYSGRYFLHGWAIVYCPILICEVPGPFRRIDDTWIFIHRNW